MVASATAVVLESIVSTHEHEVVLGKRVDDVYLSLELWEYIAVPAHENVHFYGVADVGCGTVQGLLKVAGGNIGPWVAVADVRLHADVGDEGNGDEGDGGEGYPLGLAPAGLVGTRSVG